MKTEDKKHSHLADILLCGIFVLVFACGYQIDILTGGINYILSSLLVFILIIWILIRFVRKLIFWLKNRTKRNFIPVAIYPFAILISAVMPDLESLESRPIITAHYKGTQNQAFINFRQNKQFQLQWSGVVGYNKWYVGEYRQKADTLFLTYHNEKPRRFGTTILITDGKLISLGKPEDSTLYFCPFKIDKKLKSDQ